MIHKFRKYPVKKLKQAKYSELKPKKYSKVI